MSLLVLEKGSLHYGDRVIFEDADLHIAAGDRLGVIGPNGSGKSSLLRVLSGRVALDAGRIRASKGVRVAFLTQDLEEGDDCLLSEFVMSGVPGRDDLEALVSRLEQEIGEASAAEDIERTMEIAEQLSDAHEQLAAVETDYSPYQARSILKGLGYAETDWDRPMSEFSGGWRMRAVLAGLLFQRPEVLLLDEPTNHLDMPSVAWLSGFMKTLPSAVVLISHDREFLNEQVNRVASFEPEGLRDYQGNYDKYLVARAEEEEILVNRAKNVAREREKAEKFISRFRAQASKAKSVQSRVKALEKMESVEVLQSNKTMKIQFPPVKRTGDVAIHGEGLSKSYGDLEVFKDVEVMVRRGQRIGIIGPNGAGKTTLLRVLADEISANAGTVELGYHVKLGYFAQHHADKLDPTRTVYDEVYGHSEDAGMTRVRTILGALLFQGDDVDKSVSVLSGGERARVALAKLLVDPGNVMLLDEPTNHLDLASTEALAEALTQFEGTLLFVSHNRAFIRTLATHIWNVEDGRVEVYPGTLDEYMTAARARLSSSSDSTGSSGSAGSSGGAGPSGSAGPSASAAVEESSGDRRERKRRQRRWEQEGATLKSKVAKMEQQVAELEKEQAARSKSLEDPDVYSDDSRRYPLIDALQVGQKQLEETTAQWMALQEKLEAWEASKP